MRHGLPSSPEEFWALYLDPEFTVQMHLEGLGSTSAEVTAQSGSPTQGLSRTLRYGQRPDAPGPVKKIFGEEIVTTETGSYDPEASAFCFTVVPGTMADKTAISGPITVEDAPEGCTKSFSLEARVKIFGVGPVVERFIEAQARRTQDQAAAFMRAALGPRR